MFTRIVVGSDGSPTAAKAVTQAIELASTHGATLEVVSAYRPVPDTEVRAARKEAPDDVAWSVNERAEVDALLGRIVDEASRAGVGATVHAAKGEPADAILDVAEQIGADLIVVGSKGMAGVKRFMLGSVPNKVSHHAPCSVLIVHTT